MTTEKYGADIGRRIVASAWNEQEQVETEGDAHRFYAFDLARTVDREQDVVDGVALEIGGCRCAASIDDRELVRERFDRAFDALASGAAQFDEIVRRRNRDEEPAVIAQHAAELAAVHARRDRHDAVERGVGVRNETIGV